MQRRYRYRCYPDSSQQSASRGALGCARVVFNDGLRLRQDACAAGLPYIKDVDVADGHHPGQAPSNGHG